MNTYPNIFKAKNLDEFKSELNEKFLKDERERYLKFLDNHLLESKELNSRFDSNTDNKIGTIAIIFAAVVLFTNNERISLWLLASISCMLLCLILGFWAKSLSLQSSRWWSNKIYADAIQRHWQRAEELGDAFVKFERETMGPQINEMSKEKNEDRFLELIHLDADKVISFFDMTFFGALIFLLFELLSKISF